ncbi:hypothetical protein [Nocardia wallacei]|uniref:hypothetical protein n=1 Tax=Nocardia wallacei TaxID=480035 RepID=UPI002457F2ED|nr:hypothetical protein [Nocardia wallacei]
MSIVVEIFHNVATDTDGRSRGAHTYDLADPLTKVFEYWVPADPDLDGIAQRAMDLTAGHPHPGDGPASTEYSARGLRPIAVGDLVAIDGSWRICTSGGWDHLQPSIRVRHTEPGSAGGDGPGARTDQQRRFAIADERWERAKVALARRYRLEMAFLDALGARPRIIRTGGGATAIEADLPAAEDPTGALYMVITTGDWCLADSRSDITEYLVMILARADDGDPVAIGADPASLRGAYYTAIDNYRHARVAD